MTGPAQRAARALARRVRSRRDAGERVRPLRRSTWRPTGDRVLVVGWFSWPDMAATAGDLLARDVVCDWLRVADRRFDVANAPAFGEGVDWRTVDPDRYSDLVFVCGPIEGGRQLNELLERFGGSRLVGLDLSMLRPLEVWNPFDLLFERDSTRMERPDLAFVSAAGRVPVVGAVLVEPYGAEYPESDRQHEAADAVERLLAAMPIARMDIDTRLPNAGGLRTPSEIESAIARMEGVVTTRLHGLVLALKNGVPALVIDPVAGGAKLSRQAAAVGWPMIRVAGELDDDDLRQALAFCLGEEARELARACAERATTLLDGLQAEFTAALAEPRRS